MVVQESGIWENLNYNIVSVKQPFNGVEAIKIELDSRSLCLYYGEQNGTKHLILTEFIE